MDTCGECGSVALFRATALVGELLLPERMASAGLLGAVRSVLDGAELGVGDLRAVGVVNGPGSFTGVRVGLAVAKGLCEGASLALATVSRLAVLAEAGGGGARIAALRAGRDQLYVRDGASGAERMMLVDEFLSSVSSVSSVSSGSSGSSGSLAIGEQVVYAEPEVGAMLGGRVAARLVAISAKDAVGLVRECLRAGGTAVATADANYVRDEGAIYRRAGERTVAFRDSRGLP